jgi:hypothetical protein
LRLGINLGFDLLLTTNEDLIAEHGLHRWNVVELTWDNDCSFGSWNVMEITSGVFNDRVL